MTRLNEELLNAYIDGALEAQARAEVEARLKTDAAARELLEKLRRANALASEAFDAPMRDPVPPPLVDTILSRPGGGAQRERTFRSHAWRPRATSIRAYAVPMAAALALALGISAGLFLGRQPAQAPDGLALGPVDSGSPLHRLLETHPSGRYVEIGRPRGPARRLGIVATFRDRHRRACREVEVLPAGTDHQPLAAGVACRTAQGGWVVEGAARLAQTPSTTGQDFEPSGVSEKDALDGLLAMLGAQAALSAEDEQILMRRRWK